MQGFGMVFVENRKKKMKNICKFNGINDLRR